MPAATDPGRRRPLPRHGTVVLFVALVAWLYPTAAMAKKTKGEQALVTMGVMLGFAAVGGAVAGGLYGGAELAAGDASEMSDALAIKGYAKPCVSDSAACRAIDDKLEYADDLRVGSVATAVLTGLGVLVILGILTENLARSGEGPRQTWVANVELTPIVGPHTGGVALTASW